MTMDDTEAEKQALLNRFKALKRKYGKDVDQSLGYTKGRLIHKRYLKYKQADEECDAAANAYKKAAGPIQRLGNNARCNPTDHEMLKYLAARASEAFKRCRRLRSEFNTEYSDILVAKRQYQGHASREMVVQRMAEQFETLRRFHDGASKNGQNEGRRWAILMMGL